VAAQQKRVGEQLKALREHVEDRDAIAAKMMVTPDMAGDSSTMDRTVGEDPTIFESLAKGPDLHVLMSEQDPLNDDIRRGYVNDKLFRKILENPEDHTGFQIWDDFIWMKNCRGEDMLCVPIATSLGSTLHG
jgi:hypothetical protein